VGWSIACEIAQVHGDHLVPSNHDFFPNKLRDIDRTESHNPGDHFGAAGTFPYPFLHRWYCCPHMTQCMVSVFLIKDYFGTVHFSTYELNFCLSYFVIFMQMMWCYSLGLPLLIITPPWKICSSLEKLQVLELISKKAALHRRVAQPQILRLLRAVFHTELSLTMFMLSFFEVPKGVLEKNDYFHSMFFFAE
jgi:hypothetical protein